MKQHAVRVASYDALIRVSIKSAEAHGLDEIRISVPRAKELLHDLTILKKAAETPVKPEPRHRLDSIINIDTFALEQAEVMNKAMSKLLS